MHSLSEVHAKVFFHMFIILFSFLFFSQQKIINVSFDTSKLINNFIKLQNVDYNGLYMYMYVLALCYFLFYFFCF
jgi:hypothetical protein